MRHVFRARTRRALSVSAGLVVVLAGLASVSPASANPAGTGLVISEVYGAGGNSGAVLDADFVELYNPTASAVSLTGDYVHYRSASGSSGGTPYALTGSVPAGGHYLIQMGAAGANGAALPTPDAVATPAFSLAAAGGQVYLLSSATPITTNGDQAGAPGVVDMVGALGSSSFETAPTSAAASTTSSLNRSATGADSDDNTADFSTAAPTPQNAGTVTPPPPPTDYSIAQIQGTDTDTSPHVGETVITKGVVTADYATGGFNGFYLQTAGTGGGVDATPGASDAVFVFGSAAAATVHLGDFVQVQGKVSEFAGTTEIGASAADVTVLTDSHDPVTPAAIPYPTTDAAREAHEGELLAPTNDLTVTDNFDLNAFGEIGLATGDHQLVQPTDVANPTSDPAGVAAVQADNARRAVTLDDGSSISFLNNANKGIPLPWLTTDNPVRIGSSATLHEPVILEFRNSQWDLQPTTPVTGEGADVATFGDTRAANQAPRAVGGDLRLATFNVENFFPTSAADYTALDTGQHLHVVQRPSRHADHGQPVLAQRPAGRVGRHQPAAPAGQGDPGDQQPRRRRDVAGGDRELRAVRQGPRRRARQARGRTQPGCRHDPVGLRPVARPGRPPADRRAGRHPYGVHLQPGHGPAGRLLRRPGRPVRPGRAVRQRARAAGPGVRTQGCARLRRLPRGGEPPQVEG